MIMCPLSIDAEIKAGRDRALTDASESHSREGRAKNKYDALAPALSSLL